MGKGLQREQLEKHQVWFYLIAVAAGGFLGVSLRPPVPDTIVYVPLGLLLYATFVQAPLAHLPVALLDRRYLSAALVANFVFVPAAAWGLGWIVPREPAVLLGVYMVLLVPCTDWFIVFSHLGRGDAALAIGSTPVLLLGQFLLLPVYLWLFMGETFSEVIRIAPFVNVFLLLLVLPLLLAGGTQMLADRRPVIQRAADHMVWLPAPCLALVLFLIALSEAPAVMDVLGRLERVALAFVLYLALAAAIGIRTARLFRLRIEAGRTLIFSLGTRNSFVVLPFALALPPGWEAAVAVVVLQPLVELLGMLVYLRIVPRWKMVWRGMA